MERANAKVRGLVLTRHPGERVVIGPDITVEVVEVRTFGKGCSVRLRVVAPPGVLVDREEVRAQRPSDDGDPVDEAWLRAVGFGVYGLFADRDGGLSLGDLEWHECRRWLYGNTPLPDLPTRGHVRRLCAALGIPLTETRQ